MQVAGKVNLTEPIFPDNANRSKYRTIEIQGKRETLIVHYIVGVDIGCTFTDCVALKVPDDGSPPIVKIGKSPSIPPDF